MKNENSPLYDAKVQKILNKLISEENLSYMTYNQSLYACDPAEAVNIYDMFLEIAEDELNDRAKKLIKFAIANDYDIPVNIKEYKKYASEASWKLYDGLKKNKDAAYYVTEAIKSEKDAIESYEEALKLIDELPYELYSIIQGNYYDEVEHLNNLHTLELANSACATLSWY